MNATLLRHRSTLTLALAAATAFVAACDTDPTGPDTPDAAPTLVVGQVRAASTAPAAFASPSDLSGIEVSVAGGRATTTTDAEGVFRLETRSEDGRVRLRFRRGSMDVELEVEGLVPGGTLHVRVSLGDRGASLDDVGNDDRAGHGQNDDRGNDDGRATGVEFEGELASMSLAGDAPTRVARAELNGLSGQRAVDIVEGETAFDQDGDVLSFSALLDGVAAGRKIRMEGNGATQADGSLRAGSVKVEVEEGDQAGNDDRGGAEQGEFEGRLVSLTRSGTAPQRMARVVLSQAGAQVTVDIAETGTAFESRGDLLSFDAMLAGYDAGRAIKIEGDGTRQADGAFRATSVKVEVDD